MQSEHHTPPAHQGNPWHHHAARYGSTGHIIYHEHQEPGKATSVSELVRPWTVRQWIAGGKMHREASPREVPRFELFFDLLYVAVIHQLAEAAIEEPGLPAVVRFVLTFWPSWSIWDEARKYANVSGTDDLLHRTWILIGMITILGYSASTSAIELETGSSGVADDFRAVQSAAAFWLGIKATRVIVLFLYAYRLPLFRTSQILGGVAVLVPMLAYMPLLWVKQRTTQIICASLGIGLDLMRLDIVSYNVLGRLTRWRLEREGDGGRGPVASGERRGLLAMPILDQAIRIPAMNIEHSIERSSAFVVIVLGELVMNLLYTAKASDLGLSLKFGKACLGMMIAWALNYLYLLPSEPNAEYEHALRRSWLTGTLFTFLHFPLVACLILASAACGELMQSTYVSLGVTRYWTGGLGGAILCVALIDGMHRDLSAPHAQRIPRVLRSISAVVGACVLTLYSLITEGHDVPSLVLLVMGAFITWVLTLINVVGMLPRRGAYSAIGDGASVIEEREDGVAAL